MDVIFNECGALFWWKAYISNEVLWVDQLYSLSLLPLSSNKIEQGDTPSDQTASKSPSTLNDKIKGENEEARERKTEIWHWNREMEINEGIPQGLYF